MVPRSVENVKEYIVQKQASFINNTVLCNFFLSMVQFFRLQMLSGLLTEMNDGGVESFISFPGYLFVLGEK